MAVPIIFLRLVYERRVYDGLVLAWRLVDLLGNLTRKAFWTPDPCDLRFLKCYKLAELYFPNPFHCTVSRWEKIHRQIQRGMLHRQIASGRGR